MVFSFFFSFLHLFDFVAVVGCLLLCWVCFLGCCGAFCVCPNASKTNSQIKLVRANSGSRSPWKCWFPSATGCKGSCAHGLKFSKAFLISSRSDLVLCHFIISCSFISHFHAYFSLCFCYTFARIRKRLTELKTLFQRLQKLLECDFFSFSSLTSDFLPENIIRLLKRLRHFTGFAFIAVSTCPVLLSQLGI